MQNLTWALDRLYYAPGVKAMMDALKKQKKDGELTEDDQKNLEEKLQKMTDDFIKQIDKRIDVKTKEVMSV